MSRYAIGDVQGCSLTLQALLKRISFDSSHSRLWLAGDLVNRGPRSLEALRWAREQSPHLTMVLGNHDLHLIARSLGVGSPKKSDSIQTILEAPDREELIAWLRSRPLLHREDDFLLVHAGLDPSWTPEEAEGLAREVEAALRGPQVGDLLAGLYDKNPARWDPRLTGLPRLQLAMKICSSIRICGPDGTIPFAFNGSPDLAPPGYVPWFAHPRRKSSETTVICGHWAALGLKLAPNLLALDSGCVYGRELSAVRLEDRAVFQEPKAD
jgi:bis(5'-nucleosyl)-tetraphosphatase (symmetrical)